VTSILAVIGEFERELIRARTDEGRKRAQARGVRFGRKPKLSQYQIEEAIARREAGETLSDIGRRYNVSHSTISRLASDLGVGEDHMANHQNRRAVTARVRCHVWSRWRLTG